MRDETGETPNFPQLIREFQCVSDHCFGFRNVSSKVHKLQHLLVAKTSHMVLWLASQVQIQSSRRNKHLRVTSDSALIQREESAEISF